MSAPTADASRTCLEVDLTAPSIGIVPEGFAQPTENQEHYHKNLHMHESLMVCQTSKGWCARVCCGCEPKQEFRVHERASGKQGKQVFHILEETGCCTRCCCGGNRNWSMQMNLGDTMSGTQPLLQFERPLRCPMSCGKCCCCHQEVQVFSADDDGNAKDPLGNVKETCWCCVPQFKINTPDGKTEFLLRQPTCCGGACVNYCDQGQGCCCSCRIPFYVYLSDMGLHASKGGTLSLDDQVGEITKVWGGMRNEVLSADKFECTFPATSDPASKARLLAATLMINQLFFEGQYDEAMQKKKEEEAAKKAAQKAKK